MLLYYYYYIILQVLYDDTGSPVLHIICSDVTVKGANTIPYTSRRNTFCGTTTSKALFALNNTRQRDRGLVSITNMEDENSNTNGNIINANSINVSTPGAFGKTDDTGLILLDKFSEDDLERFLQA